jgi:hypothetical protein
MRPARQPLYSAALDDWLIARACAGGESEVKKWGARYLPPTSGMKHDGYPNGGSSGRIAYDNYIARAIFPSVFQEAVAVALGTLHREPPTITLPNKLEPLRERAMSDGNGLDALLRVINGEQLTTGRLGLMVDPVEGGKVTDPPLIHVYSAEAIINWDWPHVVVLDQSGEVRDEHDNWHREDAYLRLSLRDGAFITEEYRGNNFDALREPHIGGTRLDAIPWVFCNAADMRPEPETPPLIGLARLALSIYKSEADYRQALYMQGQDTLVVSGMTGDTTARVGAGAAIFLPKGGDAKYIGVSSQGLPEMRQALENDYKRAARLGLGLLDTASRERESGEALKTRVQASTASLTQIAIAGAQALERSLKITARWMNANPDEVSVAPNLEFAKDTFDPKELTELLSAKSMGAPLSLQTIHELLRGKDITNKDFDTEISEIADENDALSGGPADGD